ncbi:hypothetical protein PPYR_01990 [Photinus pyralis]|uniref:SH2 domain-containing protein n=1 Tax=Photinus pyralis TaxID=7054 RepID=A0A5N4B6M8_PHOPY|nr:hypothetical protein PPYR_01990 [Photinus pyralis]
MMVTSGVVWCLKNDRWIPLQLSSVRLHGVVTQAHWAAVSKFLQEVANKQFILQENGFTELTEQQKEVLLKQVPKNDASEVKEKQWQELVAKDSSSVNDEKLDSSKCDNVDKEICSKFVGNNFLEKTDVQNSEAKTDRKNSLQSDEIVLRLLRKYSKYSRGALADNILTAIDDLPEETPRVRKRGVTHKEERLYENCNECVRSSDEETLENQRNEHVLRWLKEQSKWNAIDANRKFSLPCPDNRTLENELIRDRRTSCVIKTHSRKSSLSSVIESKQSTSSPTTSRKSSVSSPSTSDSRKLSENVRKNSVTSNSSCSESEEGSVTSGHWQKILMKNFGPKKLEEKIRKQRRVWARNTRKLSVPDVSLQLWYFRKIKRIEAEKKLLLPENDHGAFLIRDSENELL